MKTVCAWCGDVIAEDCNPEDTAISHGCCLPCKKRELDKHIKRALTLPARDNLRKGILAKYRAEMRAAAFKYRYHRQGPGLNDRELSYVWLRLACMWRGLYKKAAEVTP